MDKTIEAEGVQEFADCKMKNANANAACCTVGRKKQIKHEPEDVDWPEVAVNVSDSLIVKIEACDSSSQVEHRRPRSSMKNLSTEIIKSKSPKSEYPCEEHKFRPETSEASTKLALDKTAEPNSRMENADTIESNLLIQKQIKQEPLDWPKDSVDVSDSLYVKIEVWDDNMEMKNVRDSNIEAPAKQSSGHSNWKPVAEASSPSYILNTDNGQPVTNSNIVLYKYSCKHCNYKCMYASNLKFHMMTHTGEKPFACNHCNYKCSQASFLKRHMRTHTGEKPYSCEHCDYKCSQVRDLKIHTMNHSGVKQFNCEHCDYQCSQASHLKRHVRTHTGVKPYLCGHCDYKCTQADNLKRHLRTHTGEKPFKCEQCNYKCRQASHLKRHLKMHADGKALSCDHCDYKCRRVDSLDRHLSAHVAEKA